MNTRRIVLTCLLYCLGAADQLFARSIEMQPAFQPTSLAMDADTIPAFQIAVFFCLGALLFGSLLWISVLKLVRLDTLERIH